jgi:hypothetical protein
MVAVETSESLLRGGRQPQARGLPIMRVGLHLLKTLEERGQVIQ